MRNQPIPLVTGFYRDADRPWSQQDVWNYMPCKAERAGTRSPLMLKTPPGLFPWLEVADSPPVRGIHDVEGRLFAVIGTTLYRLTPTGVALPIGTVPGNGRVQMDHNQISGGNQLMVTNGSAGYVYDSVDQSFERVTDEGYPGSYLVRFMDGYMLGIDPSGRFAFNSDPANAKSYNTLNRWTSEYRPDRLVSMAPVGGDLLLLSASSGEFFANSGQYPQPFQSKRIFLDRGCAGPFAVAEADSTAFWLGADGFFYQLEGYSALRISTRPVEQAVRGLDWWNAFAFVWESEGHTCIGWTFLDGQTWLWDCSQKEWHRRESYGLDRWRVNCTTKSGGQWYAGDFQAGRVWRIQWGYPWEGDTEFVSGFTQPVMHDNQNELIHNRLEIVMDTGQPDVASSEFPEQPTGPTISGAAGEADPNGDFSFQYTVTAGSSPVIKVEIVGGNLPEDWTVDVTGLLEGTTPASGLLNVVLRATDANGLTYDHPDEIPIDTGIFVVSVIESTAGPAMTHEVELPECEAGEQMMMFISLRHNNSVHWPTMDDPSGWDQVVSASPGNNNNLSTSWVYHIVATGTEGESVSVNVTSEWPCSMAALVYRIRGADGNAPSSGADDGPVGGIPTPPNLAPGWTGEDALWFAAFSSNYGSAPVAYPLPNDQAYAGASVSPGTRVAACTTIADGASLHPGQFTLGGPTAWAAYTLAFRKAP